MSKLKRRTGITLIELIITLGILGIITSLVFSFFLSNKKTLNNVEIKSDLQYEAKEVMNKISQYAMEATNVEYNQGENSIRFHMADSSEIVFTIKGGNSVEINNKVVITGQEIIFGDGGISDATICTSLKTITVYGDKNRNIQVELELEKSGINYSVKDSFVFRNSSLK